jgi:glycerophosphoryl diester phosphodiesterase
VTLKKQFSLAIIAHRGFKKSYPENTLLSFEKAIDAHADYVEFDLHETSDHEIVVNHDASTGRTGNTAYVIKDTPLATLKTLDMGSGQKIPTFEEVITLCKGKIGLQIEIKVVGIVERVVQLIEKNKMESDVIISSFTHTELQKAKSLNKNILCSALEPIMSNAIKAVFSRGVFIEDAKKIGADGVHPLYKYINAKFCQKAHAAGLYVNPWTIDSPQQFTKLQRAGVDGIISNDPQGLYDFLQK